jgi:hypothetical protein
MTIPPFSTDWVERMESIGSVPVSDSLKARLSEFAPDVRRKAGWEIAGEIERKARDAGCAGVVLMGLRFDSVVKEAPQAWPSL